MGLLDAIFSRIDAAKRRAADMVANPGGLLSVGFGPEFGGAPSLRYNTEQARGLLGSVFPEVRQAGADEMRRYDREVMNPAMLDVAFAAPVTVYHGSPHLFDKFDMGKIGTGEGAQAYGHGLYFAESPQVARSYQMSTQPVTAGGFYDIADAAETAAVAAGASADDAARVANHIADALENSPSLANVVRDDRIPERVYKAAIGKAREALEAKTAGNLYKVELSPNPEDFLQWDKPLSEQPKAVKQMANAMFAPHVETTPLGPGLVDVKVGGGTIGSFPPDKVPTVVANISDYMPMKGEDLYRYLGMNESRSSATGKLTSQQVPGIRYLDQGSRGAGDGTYNYVLFDDALAKILERNGQPVGLLGK